MVCGELRPMQLGAAARGPSSFGPRRLGAAGCAAALNRRVGDTFAAMPFVGFADAGAKFFQRLAKNQDREWFRTHKAEFEEGYQAPLKELLAGVRAGIDRA